MQKTTQKTRLHGCTAWSALLFFACNKIGGQDRIDPKTLSVGLATSQLSYRDESISTKWKYNVYHMNGIGASQTALMCTRIFFIVFRKQQKGFHHGNTSVYSSNPNQILYFCIIDEIA